MRSSACWSRRSSAATAPRSRLQEDRSLRPILDIRLNQDGSLSTEPRILQAGSSSTDRAVADAAVRAIRKCRQFEIPAQFAPYYSDWKVLNVQFDPPLS